MRHAGDVLTPDACRVLASWKRAVCTAEDVERSPTPASTSASTVAMPPLLPQVIVSWLPNDTRARSSGQLDSAAPRRRPRYRLDRMNETSHPLPLTRFHILLGPQASPLPRRGVVQPQIFAGLAASVRAATHKLLHRRLQQRPRSLQAARGRPRRPLEICTRLDLSEADPHIKNQRVPRTLFSPSLFRPRWRLSESRTS